MRRDHGTTRAEAHGQAAVSSVIGTVLMLGVTVTVFAAVSIGVLAYLDNEPDATRSDLAVEQSGQRLLLRHRGGDALALADGQLILNVAGTRTQVDMTDSGIAGQTADGASWGVGESLCISGPQPPCLYHETQFVVGVTVIHQNRLVLSDGLQPGGSGGQPDLRVTYLGASPGSPGATDAVTFSARVTNDGTMAFAPIQVSFRVGGSEVATATIPAGFAASAQQDVTSSPTWTAVAGTQSITVVVDPAGIIAESDETNNQDAATMEVADGPADPGFPYHDLDCDGVYDAGTDGELDPTDIQDGTHDAGTDCLVIPSSVGPIVATKIDFDADDGVTIAVDLTATGNNITIDANAAVVLDGITITAQGGGNDIQISTPALLSVVGTTITSSGHTSLTGASVDMTNAVLSTSNSNMRLEVTSTAGDLTATDAALTSLGILTLDAAGNLGADGADMETLTNGDAITLTATGDVRLDAADLDSRGALDIDAGGNVDLTGAGLETLTNGDAITVDAGGACTADDATVTARGTFAMVCGGALSMTAATVTMLTNGATATWTAGGAMDVSGATVAGRDSLTFTAGAGLTATGLAAATGQSNVDITLNAGTGPLDVQQAVLTAHRHLDLLSGGDITAHQSDLAAGNNDRLALTAGSASNSIYLEAASFTKQTNGQDKQATMAPSGVFVVEGTGLAAGSWSY